VRRLNSTSGWLNRHARGILPVAVAFVLRVIQAPRAATEDRVEYRYEDYNEDDQRMHIQTHALHFDVGLGSKVTAKGLLVYDGISGATPTGELPPLGSKQVPLASLHDIRRAGTFGLGIAYGPNTTTPEFSYSEESDYISRGLSLTHTIDFNQKNTTLVLGAAHDFDRVGGGVLSNFRSKDTTDFLLGLNQLLSPKTVLSANLSLGYANGYLDDPYRLTTFFLAASPDPILSDPGAINPVAESRPRHRFKQSGLISLTQFVSPFNASIEGSYRLYHDDWGIWAHTVSLTWLQKLGQHVTLAPTFRYYRQGAADFYSAGFQGVSFDQYANGTQVAFEDGVFVGFQGDPGYPAAGTPGLQFVNVPGRPSYYSSDYRLSEFEAFTFGIGAQVRIMEHVTVDVAFNRYEMHGLDRLTPRSAYPSANIFTIGCGVWF
jgi:opacity protein-like surface antigen